VELTVLDWFRCWLGLPEESAGLLTTGGSEANLTALVVARERLAEADRPRAVLYGTEHRHRSIDRAAKVMGLRSDQLRTVPADNDHRLEPAALREAVSRDRAAGRQPWAVVANAGATNTGAVDPLAVLADLCTSERLWLHVDAAYGWSAVLTEEGHRELGGIDRADSVTLDPHKWLAQAFDVGCLLVREGSLLTQTFALRPEYMQDVQPAEDEVNFADHGIALTRRFRALKIWLSVKVLGVGWYRALVTHCCRLADYAQALLDQAGCFEILSPRRLSVLAFRHLPSKTTDLDAHNLALVELVRRSGRVFLSSTRLHGAVAIRLCFVNWRTTAADVEEVVELLIKHGSEPDIGRPS
jgi:aromatic-L-amino-acid decarboxylase